MQMSAAVTVHGRRKMLRDTALGAAHDSSLAYLAFSAALRVFLSGSLVMKYTFSKAHFIPTMF